MKRASILGALAIVAGLAVSSAYANHLGNPGLPAPQYGCSLITDNNGGFPRNGHYIFCGTGSYNANASAQFQGTVKPHIRNKLYNANMYLWVVENKAEDTGIFGLPPVPGLWGHTGKSTSGVYIYTVVRQSSDLVNGAGNVVLSQSKFQNLVRHEQGHAVDIAYGLPSTKTNGAFAQTLQVDWDRINARTESVIFPNGIPPQKWVATATGGNWQAYSPPPGPSTVANKRNQTILTDLYPHIFGGTTADEIIKAKGELFANCWAHFRGASAFDYDNPYHPDGGIAGVLGGKTLSNTQIFSQFDRLCAMTSSSSPNPSYMYQLFNNANFNP